MKSRAIQIVTLLAVITTGGIIVWQIFWFRKAFDVQEKEFDQNVFVALQQVAEQVLTINNQPIPGSQLVNQLSSNYFVVSVNGEIDTRILESLLKNAFRSHEILLDFEYGVYDCNSQKLVYGNYVSFNANEKEHPSRELPQWKNDLYYFSVNFPNKSSQLTGSLGIWLFSSAVLLVVVFFFAFALITIFRQRQLSRVQKDFVNNMTHEFKTPVSTILVTSRLLDKPEIKNNSIELSKYVALIQTEAQRLKNQVERILQVAVWGEKKVEYQLEKVDVNEYLNQAIQISSTLLQEKNGRIEKKLSEGSMMIVADKLHFTNAIFSIIDNAIKYNSKEPLIFISSRIENNLCIIQIADNGIGIERKDRRKIFDRFYRINTSDVHDVKGFGLGLFYVKKVIDEMGGSISTTENDGAGSIFTLQFPLS